jgi:hypothetical protein
MAQQGSKFVFLSSLAHDDDLSVESLLAVEVGAAQ